jgi:hypothetical protein
MPRISISISDFDVRFEEFNLCEVEFQKLIEPFNFDSKKHMNIYKWDSLNSGATQL